MAVRRRSLLASPALLATPARAAARPVLVELFTSQGCSSCPPADALLSDLARRQDVLALGFHVDYWDRLGWRDPFSLREATARQRGYSALMRLSFVYTPQAVVDGRSDVIGSDRARLVEAIAAARPANDVPLSMRRAGGDVLIRSDRETARDASVLLVTFTPRHETRVTAGENRGRTLVHSNIVRAIRPLDTAPAWRVAVDPSLGVAAIAQGADGTVLGLASLAPAA